MASEDMPNNGHPHHWYQPPERPEPDRSDTGLLWRLLLVVLFTVLVFVLGHSMVHNHFFAGGALNNHQGKLVGP